MSILKAVHAGLDRAGKDCVKISGLQGLDVKPKEDQVKCALYRELSSRGYLVHVEARYPLGNQRCDLVVIDEENDRSVAIE